LCLIWTELTLPRDLVTHRTGLFKNTSIASEIKDDVDEAKRQYKK